MTRSTAIVALGRAEFDFAHLDLLEAGANAILPLPPGGDWDDRLTRLIHVPARREARFGVDLAIEGGLRSGQRFSGRALNLSVHGILLECRHPLDVGDDLRLTFEMPEGHGGVEGDRHGRAPVAAPPLRGGDHLGRGGRPAANQALRRDRRRGSDRKARRPRLGIIRAALTPASPIVVARPRRRAPSMNVRTLHVADIELPPDPRAAARPGLRLLVELVAAGEPPVLAHRPRAVAPLPQPRPAADQRRAAAVDAAACPTPSSCGSTRT